MTEPERLGVVVTGGSGGLGFAFASGFLEAGDRVVICGRNTEKLEHALLDLSGRDPAGSVYAAVCDVSNAADLKDFSLFVKDKPGRVDRWINNAGSAGTRKRHLWELDEFDICEVC
jgi:chlorophyll(ide) b reductase